MASKYIKDKQRLVGIRNMLFIIAGVNTVISVVMSVTSSFMENTVPVYLQSLISVFLAYIIPIFLYAKSTGITAETAEKRFYMKGFNIWTFLFAALMGAAFQFVMIAANIPVNLLFNSGGSYLPETVFELVAAIIIIAILPAIFEEFLFRGIVVGSMVEFNTVAATVFSSVMFGILHADAYGLVGYILMGFILAGIVRRCDSIYPCMAFHFANNLTAIILGYFNEEFFYAPEAMIGLFATGIVLFFVMYFIFGILYKKT